MVDAVTGRAALALLSGPSAADQQGNRKNPLLPTPLNQPEKTGFQRAPAILRFDTPRVSDNTFAALQNGAVLSAVREEVTLEERVRLETELRRRIQVIETGGNPGSPGTPDSTSTITVTEGRLDQNALGALTELIEQLRRGSGELPSRFVPALTRELQQFSARVGNAESGDALAGIIRRIENSVIGEDGLQFSDLFRDPGLFIKIAAGLGEFSSSTNHRAADALRDVIFRLGDRRLYDGNPRNDSLRAIGSAIDRLGRALDDEPNAVPALQDFLQRIGGEPANGNGRYAARIADVLDQALNDIRGGALDLEAIRRLEAGLQDISALQDIAGNADDRLRQQATDGLQSILDRYASVTNTTQTIVTPGQPAVPATPGEKTLVITEETRLVPSVEIVERVVAVYQAAQEQFRPLQKLSEPPPPVPNLQALVTPSDRERDGDKDQNRFRIDKDDDRRKSRFGFDPITADNTALIPNLGGYGQAGSGLSTLGSGLYLDSTA